MSTQPPSGARRVWQTPPPLSPAQRHLIIRTAQAHAVTFLERRLASGPVTETVTHQLQAELRHHPSQWAELYELIEARFRDAGLTDEVNVLAIANADTYILALETLKGCVGFLLDQLAEGPPGLAPATTSVGRSGTLAQVFRRPRTVRHPPLDD